MENYQDLEYNAPWNPISIRDEKTSGNRNQYYQSTLTFVSSGKNYIFAHSKNDNSYVISEISDTDGTITDIKSGKLDNFYSSIVIFESEGKNYLFGQEESSKTYFIAELTLEGVGPKIVYYSWGRYYGSVATFKWGGKNYLFAQSEVGKRYFISELKTDGSHIEAEVKHGDWHYYYETTVSFVYNDKNYLFVQNKSDKYYSIVELKVDGNNEALGADITSGRMEKYFGATVAFYTGRKCYLFAQTDSTNEFFTCELKADGSPLFLSAVQGAWGHYYGAVAAFNSDGNTYLYGQEGNKYRYFTAQVERKTLKLAYTDLFSGRLDVSDASSMTELKILNRLESSDPIVEPYVAPKFGDTLVVGDEGKQLPAGKDKFQNKISNKIKSLVEPCNVIHAKLSGIGDPKKVALRHENLTRLKQRELSKTSNTTIVIPEHHNHVGKWKPGEDIKKLLGDLGHTASDLNKTATDLFSGHFGALAKDLEHDAQDFKNLKEDFDGLWNDGWKELAEFLIEPHKETIKKILERGQNAIKNKNPELQKQRSKLTNAISGDSVPSDNWDEDTKDKSTLKSTMTELVNIHGKGLEWEKGIKPVFVYGLGGGGGVVLDGSASIGGVIDLTSTDTVNFLSGFESMGVSLGVQG